MQHLLHGSALQLLVRQRRRGHDGHLHRLRAEQMAVPQRGLLVALDHLADVGRDAVLEVERVGGAT